MLFDKATQIGIRNDDRQPLNSQGLIECRNIAATEFGGVPFRDLVQPITNAALAGASITKAHPWPQLFRGKAVTLLCDDDAIFTVTESATGNWTISALTLYQFSSYNWDADSASTGTIPASGKEWHFVDLWTGFMLFNENCIIFRAGFSAKTFIVTEVTIKTGGVFQDGRLFFAGFNSSNINTLADWATYIATLQGTVPTEEAKMQTAAVGQNWCWWGTQGMGDMLRFFSLTFMKYGSMAGTPDTEFTDDDPYWLRLAYRREAHFSPMRFSGTVNRVMQLGNGMAVYGSNGVHALEPVNTDRVKTFGHREFLGLGSGVGIATGTHTRAACGGNEHIQAFVDESRDVWILTPDMKAEYLGYRHLFSSVDDLLVHYDPHEREFHFAASDRCYRLRQGAGMARAPQIPTTVQFGRSNSSSASIGIYANDASPTAVTVQTEWFSMDGVGQITNIHLLGSSGWTVTPHFYRTPTDSEQTGSAIAVDGRNAAALQLSGTKFSIVATHADRTAAKLFSMDVEMDGGERRRIGTWRT